MKQFIPLQTKPKALTGDSLTFFCAADSVLPEELQAWFQNLTEAARKKLEEQEAPIVSPLPLTSSGGLVGFYNLPKTCSARTLTRLGTQLAQTALPHKCSTLRLLLPETLPQEEASRLLTAFSLALRPFDTYFSEKKPLPQTVEVYAPMLGESAWRTLNNRIAAVSWSRQLGNEPANVMTPKRLAQEARDHLAPLGVQVQVLDRQEIEAQGMAAFLSVAKGSKEEPQFLILRYEQNPSSDKRIALVGKGLTYDSGGYSIKPTDGMLTMKCDMCGSAAVLGALHFLAAEQAPVNVVGLVAACENMISGGAYKPGDIIGTLAGKTIEVNNTDAEGRLTLADAVTYADRVVEATEIYDICTLTGACVVALGDSYTGVLTEQESLWQDLQAAAQQTGDKVWRMPCDPDLLSGLKSDVADLKNTGPRAGGMMTAGLFVREFAGGKPWMHLDIAGPAFQDKGDSFYPQGATGVGVEYLADLVKIRFASETK